MLQTLFSRPGAVMTSATRPTGAIECGELEVEMIFFRPWTYHSGGGCTDEAISLIAHPTKSFFLRSLRYQMRK